MSVEPPLKITQWPDGNWSAWSPASGTVGKGASPESCLAWLIAYEQPTQHGKNLDNRA